jgi:hypothetical protein
VDNAQYDRGVKIKMQLDQIVDNLNNMDIHMSLVWLWTWDLIRDKFENYSQDDVFISDYTVTVGTTLDVIWDKLWANPPSDFTLEYGAEQMDEAILDWMIDENFIVAVEDDGWLNEENSDEKSE